MRIKILAELDIPDGVATTEEILEWLRFELGEISSISMSHPLADRELSFEYGTTKFEIKKEPTHASQEK